jgi:hypothetical protein
VSGEEMMWANCGRWEKRMINLLNVFKESVSGRVDGVKELCR